MKGSSLTKEDAAKLVKGDVLVVVTGDDGKPIVDKDDRDGTKRYRTRRVPVSAETIMSVNVRGGAVVVATIDGQKLTAPLPPAKAR
jgi:hypothetical protein